MGEPKPFASLSSGLLARKGTAKPAMRPQGFGQMGASIEDLGWNDMGYAPPVPAAQTPREAEMPQHIPSKITALTPAPKPGEPQAADEEDGEEEEFESAVHTQQRLIEQSFAEAEAEGEEEEEEAEARHAPMASLTPLSSDALELAGYTDDGEEEELEEEEEAEAAPREPLFTKRQQLQPQPEPEPQPQLERQPQRSEPKPAYHASAQRSPAGAKGKAAFTLRLDAERHLKLRLACAVTHRSAQQIVSGALDQYLASLPELDEVAGKLPGKFGRGI